MSVERVVVITGAASGIGAATALRLAGADTDLVMTTRANADGLAETSAAAEGHGSRVETLLGDLADPGFATRLVDAARARFGRIDQLVSNAGRAQKKDFASLGRADLTDSLGVNTFPFVELVTACMEDLAASQWGRVVSLSSFVA
ncbi:MAG: SDR family NAD(P)-dependent oxidoreductase, partial [bacterium]|nr:SDR family NAD(P)-dependent oxidoreductase [bacterium]